MSNALQTIGILIIVGLLGVIGYTAYTSAYQEEATMEEVLQIASRPTSSIRKIEAALGDRPKESIILENGEPAYITVQHCLIGCEGSDSKKKVNRTPEEAQAFANKLMQSARDGEDFDTIILKHTDDAHPGIYQMANTGMPANMAPTDPAKKVAPREKLVPAFGEVGFNLEVGEYGLAPFSASSPFGFHIIKRLK